jgi:hypothetical protein
MSRELILRRKTAFPDVEFAIWLGKRSAKRTAAGIPTWSPTVVLICRSTAYVWQSGRDAQFSADYGRTYSKCFSNGK